MRLKNGIFQPIDSVRNNRNMTSITNITNISPEKSILAARIRHANHVITIGDRKLENLVGENRTGIGESEERMISKNSFDL